MIMLPFAERLPLFSPSFFLTLLPKLLRRSVAKMGVMSTWPRYGQPFSLGTVLVVILAIAGMTLLILGGWRLSDGLNGVVIYNTSPYVHFSETTAQQEVTDGIVFLVAGAVCFVALAYLLLVKRTFTFAGKSSFF
jgi:hypothetical protein